MSLVVDVVGTPAPQGSKRGFINKKTQRVQMTESSKKVVPWRQDVVAAVLNEIAESGWDTPAGPVVVEVEFRFRRPGYHYRTGRFAHELRPDVPFYVEKKPDVDKLLRSTFDALTDSGAILDDAKIARTTGFKRYAERGESTGALIVITPLNAAADAPPSSPHAAVHEAVAAPTSTPGAATVPTTDPGPAPSALVTNGAGTVQEALL